MSILNRLNKHYVAAAAVAAGAVAVSANAAIVYSGVVNINVPSTTSGVYLNMVTGLTGASSALAGWDVNPWSSSALNFFSSTTSGQTVATGMSATAAGSVASTVTAGTLISAASIFTNNVGNQTTTCLTMNGKNLFGVKFWHEGAAAFRYGWIRISLGATAGGQPRSIVDYAYEDTGAGINAGTVPGPAGLAALAMGAIGARGRRRK